MSIDCLSVYILELHQRVQIKLLKQTGSISFLALLLSVLVMQFSPIFCEASEEARVLRQQNRWRFWQAGGCCFTDFSPQLWSHFPFHALALHSYGLRQLAPVDSIYQ